MVLISKVQSRNTSFNMNLDCGFSVAHMSVSVSGLISMSSLLN